MSNPSDNLRYGCTECGKVCEPKEYHPYWHCLLFKAGNYEVAMKDIEAHSLQERKKAAVRGYGCDNDEDFRELIKQLEASEEQTVLGMKVKVDPSMPVDRIRFEHPDGRKDELKL